MLHRVHPSPENAAALGEGVRVQMALLAYAATTNALSEPTCAAFVDADPLLAGRGAAAARWVWRSDLRKNALARFAAGATPAEKMAWAATLRGEAEAFIAGVPAALTPLDEEKPWQLAAGEFLESFYHAFSSETGLARELLGRPARFTRHDFLREFASANPELYVCSICDEGRIGTRRKDRLVSDIDHFFPKSVYPHLSIHPRNLVPICHACNSFTKGSIDPLAPADGTRLAPADITLPYHAAVFSGNAFMGVDLDAWRAADAPFAIRARKVDGATDRQIEGWALVADVPGRWNQILDEIGETAFRRLSQYLRADPSIPDDPERLLAKLDEFLGTLQEENLGRDPLTYAIKWFLAHIGAAARRDERLKDSLLDELRAWVAAPLANEERARLGRELRAILDA